MFLFAISFKDILDKIKLFVPVLLIIQIYLIIHYTNAMGALHDNLNVSRKITDNILENNKTYYIKEHNLSKLFAADLIFEAKRKKYKIEVHFGDEANMDKLPEYDYYIILDLEDKTEIKQHNEVVVGFFYNEMNIYKNKH